MNNTMTANVGLPQLINFFSVWHHDKNLIHGTTAQKQFVKLLEEVIEVYMAINPGTDPVKAVLDLTDTIRELGAKGRIKTSDGTDLKDSIGDVMVCLTNLAEREGHTIEECASTAWLDIKDRKGRMIDGTFVKEADL